MRLIAVLMCLLAATGWGQTPGESADPYVGTFRRESVVLQLAKEDGSYSGSLTVQGRKLAVTAKSTDKAVSGTFEIDGRDYAFTLTPYAAGLILTAEGLNYRLERSDQAK